MADLFDFLDYRQYLREAFEERKVSKSAFSYRMLADKIGLHASQIHRVLARQSHIAPDQIDAFAKAFGLRGVKARYFECLVRHAKAKTESESQVWLAKLADLRGVAGRSLKRQEHGIFREWFFIPLRCMLHTGRFKDEWEILAGSLTPAVRPEQVRMAVESMERLGLVQRDQDGFWHARDAHLAAEGAEAGGALRAWHHSMLRLAGEAVERFPKAMRHHGTMTLSVDGAGAVAVVDILRECRGRIRGISDSTHSPDRILHLGMQLFPVGRIPEGAA